MSDSMILLIDFGGDQARSMARRFRGGKIYCEIVKPDAAGYAIGSKKPKGIVLAGEAPVYSKIPDRVLTAGLPLLALGSCARLLCTAMGGQVLGTAIEKKTAAISFADSTIFGDLRESDRFFDRVDDLELPEGFEAIAFINEGGTPAFADERKRMYGLQFYPETHDPDGLMILANFAGEICGCDAWWTIEAFENDALEKIRRQVGGGTALLAISGGVDSSVCAALMHKAIGDRLKCLFVDTGLMRDGEVEMVQTAFSDKLGFDLITVDASERFIARLAGVTSAQQKREIVEDEMLNVLSEEVERLGHLDSLVQATIYPDILSEKHSDNGAATDRRTLKDHIEFKKLIEPLRMLFKDEVRHLGEYLGLSGEFTHRQPFPEAGLAVRCMGEVTADKLRMLSLADAIFREEVKQAGLDRRIWQYFAVLTGVMTTTSTSGREMAVALRAVSSQDAVSAYAYRLPYDLLERVVTRITEEVPGINRVLYDVTGKPPANIEWE